MPNARVLHPLALLGALLIALLASAPAPAQSPPGDPAPSLGAGDSVSISAMPFGAGGVVRQGEWAGIRVILSDSGTRPRDTAVRFHMRDDDGDTLLAERRVVLNPGVSVGAWLYVRMPWRLSSQSFFTVTVNELTESGDDAPPTIGRQLGATRVTPQQVVEPDVDLIGVIGRRPLGLPQYRNANPKNPANRLDISHEDIEIVRNLDPETMPDYWEGLAQFSTLVWEESAKPSDLRGELTPEAIRDWVRRGGHLVVAVPPVGGEWFAGENPLSDILPRVRVSRKEGVSLEAYRRLLMGPELDTIELPSDTTLHVFEIPDDASPDEAAGIIEGPHGVVVARRIYGTGMVTLIGIDIGNRALERVSLPRADRFWNRILGKRYETPTLEAVESIGDTKFSATHMPGSQHYADQYINLEIAKSTAAGIGLLLALIVFIVYWVVAGPGGFGLLRMRGLERHSWVWFGASIGVFAAIAWMGANAIRDTKVSGKHLSFLDHVYGQPAQHAITWASVLLPSYGSETLLLNTPEMAGTRQSVAVWSDSNGETAAMSFPDARRYVVDVRDPQTITVPSRATIKQFELDWSGPRRWGTPIPEPGWEPRLERVGASGKLRHDLPAPLEGVTILLCRGQLEPDRLANEQAPLLSAIYSEDLADAWEPGVELDIQSVFANGERSADENLLRRLLPSARTDLARLTASPTSLQPRDAMLDYERLALYSLLPPPRYGDITTFNRRPPVRRREAHNSDLGKWFTQPCLVIIGHIDTTDSPTPLAIRRGDRWQPIPMEGRTVVRWIYLLEPRPVMFRYDPSSRTPTRDSETQTPQEDA